GDLTLAALRFGGALALPDDEPARDRRRDQEAGQRHPVLGVRDPQSADRSKEEEVEGPRGKKRADRAGEESLPDGKPQDRKKVDEARRDRVGMRQAVQNGRGGDHRDRGESATSGLPRAHRRHARSYPQAAQATHFTHVPGPSETISP